MTAMTEQELREKLAKALHGKPDPSVLFEYKTYDNFWQHMASSPAVDRLVEFATQYGDTREREGREWHEINVSDELTYPPFDTPVLARMAYDNKKFEPIYIVVKHVDEDDCSWRTSDGDELSYWVNVTHWQVIAELKEEV